MQAAITKAIEEVGSVLLGKEQQIKLALACLFSGGIC